MLNEINHLLCMLLAQEKSHAVWLTFVKLERAWMAFNKAETHFIFNFSLRWCQNTQKNKVSWVHRNQYFSFHFNLTHSEKGNIERHWEHWKEWNNELKVLRDPYWNFFKKILENKYKSGNKYKSSKSAIYKTRKRLKYVLLLKTIKIPKLLHCCHSAVFIVNFTYFTSFSVIFVVDFGQVKVSAVLTSGF